MSRSTVSGSRSGPPRKQPRLNIEVDWRRDDTVSGFLSDLSASIMVADSLEVPGPRNHPQTVALSVPQLTRNNVLFDGMNQQVVISFDALERDTASASSIVGCRDHIVSTNDMRSFAHDYTFSILAAGTDMKLSESFPALEDGSDNKTPDLIVSNQEVMMVLEFATTRVPMRAVMDNVYGVKMYTYKEAVSKRVQALRRRNSNSKKYALLAMVVSTSSVVCGSPLNLRSSLINELCARYRFALSIVDLAILQGLSIRDDDSDQLTEDIRRSVADFPLIFQEEGNDIKVPLTRERVMMDHDDPVAAEEFARRAYYEHVKTAIPLTIRKPELATFCELREAYSSNIFGCSLARKAILQIAACSLRSRTDWEWSESAAIDDHSEFVNSVIDATRSESWRKERTEEEQIDAAMLGPILRSEEEQKKARRIYKRIRVKPCPNYRLELAKVGVQGKEFKDNAEVKLYRESKKEGFSILADTDDIDEFISMAPEERIWDINYMTSAVHNLIYRALGLHGSNSAVGLEILSSAMSTNLGRYCSIVSAIAVELCISLRQNVNKGEFVVKRLRQYDAYIIIKPTKSESHIFYMLVVPPKDSDSPPIFLPPGISKSFTHYSAYSASDWVSSSLSKLVNMVKAEAFFMTQLSQWSRYYGLTLEQGMEDPSVWKMVRVQVLVHLEDKTRTEEILTLFRYVSMEKFSMCRTDSQKMVDKLPSVLRSRLQVWAASRLLKAMSEPNYYPSSQPEEETDDDGHFIKMRKERLWIGMKNPYTDEVISKPSQLVELFYVGYATNKDAKSWDNTEFNLVKKILQYEDKLDDADPVHCGLVDRPHGEEYRFHEWSRSMNCTSADFLRNYFHQQYGPEWEAQINSKILARLKRITWDDVASLKASSTFDPSLGSVEGDKVRRASKRVKVLIRVLQVSGDLAPTPALSYSKMLKWVEEDGGLRIDLFKKNQHGGLREIYVLELRSRVVQLMTEEISRALCQELHIEMMMHPENKLRKPQEHMYQSAIKQAPFKLNISSSNDAKVWNQGHHVAKFCQFLVRVLPKMWHGVIVRSLSLWTYKRIALPDGILNFLEKHPDQPMSDPMHDRIRLAWLGAQKARWMPSVKSNHIVVESGMMQGILHYTSSLFHSAFLMTRDAMWKRLAKRQAIECTTMDMVSSDDSSRMTDIFCREEKDFRCAALIAKADHLSIRTLSPYMGIHMSPKSTYCTNGVMEFNSEFFFRASVYRPTLKWSLASLGIVEVESLVERQEIMYNQITELLEGGAGYRQASETQVAQAYLHYLLLGSSVNPLFEKYSTQLSRLPDPSLGFFLMDSTVGAGLAGFQYNLWVATQASITLNTLYATFIHQGELTTTTSGQLTRGAQIRFGNRKKTLALIKSAESVRPAWRDEIEEDPSVLYLVSRDLESAFKKMMVKLTSPSVIKSISGGNSLSRMMAASVYMISSYATTIGSNWTDLISELNKEAQSQEDRYLEGKTSLWRLLFSETASGASLTPLETLTLFPHQDHYIGLSRIFGQLARFELRPFGSRKMLRSHIQVFAEAETLPFSLEDIVKHFWFDYELPASTSTLRAVWESYKRMYPWLRDTAQTTIQNPDCHFSSQIQLRNFIARQSCKSRSVHITGAPFRDCSHRDLLVSSLLKNQLPGWTLTSPDFGVGGSVDRTDDLQSRIASYLSFPMSARGKRQKIEEALIDYREIWSGGLMRPIARRLRLGMIQQYLLIRKQKLSIPSKNLQFRNTLRSSRLGVFGGFTRRQKAQDGEWRGEGEWRGVVGGASVIIHLQDMILTSMETDSIDKLRSSENLLVGLFREMGVFECIQDTQHSHVFNMKTISLCGKGARLMEIRDFSMEGEVNIETTQLKISADSLRLVSSSQAGEFTILAYTTHPSDYKYNIEMRGDQPALSCWVNNKPLPKNIAKKTLRKFMKGKVAEGILDPDHFRIFVRG